MPPVARVEEIDVDAEEADAPAGSSAAPAAPAAPAAAATLVAATPASALAAAAAVATDAATSALVFGTARGGLVRQTPLPLDVDRLSGRAATLATAAKRRRFVHAAAVAGKLAPRGIAVIGAGAVGPGVATAPSRRAGLSRVTAAHGSEPCAGHGGLWAACPGPRRDTRGWRRRGRRAAELRGAA